MAMMLCVPQIMEYPTATGFGLGKSMLEAGLWMMPGGIMMMIFAPVSSILIKKVGPAVTLAIGAFGIGTTEFVIMGLLPEVASDLQVTIPQAGHVISAYALGVVVGAPLLAVLGARMARRHLLIALMTLFYGASTLGGAVNFTTPTAYTAEAPNVLRVDGGMTASDVTMQFIADILGAAVDRPVVMETTALGAAYLAGHKAGVCPDPAGFSKTWRLDRRFEPAMDQATRTRKWAGWQDAVRRTLTPQQR